MGRISQMGLMGQMSLISPMSRIRRGYWIFHSSLFTLRSSRLPSLEGSGEASSLVSRPVFAPERKCPRIRRGRTPVSALRKRRDDDDVLFILKNAVRRKALRHCSRLQVFGFQLIQGLHIPVVMSCGLQIRRNYG